jgi:hypothetical protein
LGVRLYGGGFKSESAARLAGEKALSEFLAGLAEQHSNPVGPPGRSVDDDAAPGCSRCSGLMKLVRTIPRVGSHPELFVFRCTLCSHVETRAQGGQGR